MRISVRNANANKNKLSASSVQLCTVSDKRKGKRGFVGL